jgi:hypothetical protein
VLVEDLIDRRPPRRRSPVLHREADRGRARLAAGVQPHADITISSVEMTDWQMLVEKWESAHNFPRFTTTTASRRAERFTTTLQYLRAFRGQFTFEDHETPWSVVCRNLDINIGNLPKYHGTATFNGGTVAIQDFVPMWANMKAQFVIDGSRIHLERIDMRDRRRDDGSRPATSTWRTGPNQGYQ